MSGTSVGNCNSIENYGDATTRYYSYLLDCDDGDVIMNLYTSTDCSDDAVSTAISTYGSCIGTLLRLIPSLLSYAEIRYEHI